MTTTIKKCCALSLAAVCFFAITQAMAATAIIAHPSNPTAGLSPEEIAKIYLGQKREFPNGTPAVPVDQPEGSTARTRFVTNVLHKDERVLKSYWTKLQFTGKGRAPEVVGGDDLVRDWVSKNPSAIGYVDGKALDKSVKVLLIVP